MTRMTSERVRFEFQWVSKSDFLEPGIYIDASFGKKGFENLDAVWINEAQDISPNEMNVNEAAFAYGEKWKRVGMIMDKSDCILRISFGEKTIVNINKTVGRFHQFQVTRINVGQLNGGYARDVYNFNCKDLPFRFGLTAHIMRGSWSSWPPHEFEQNALKAQFDSELYFLEKFAFVTEPEGGWLVLGAKGHYSPETISDNMYVYNSQPAGFSQYQDRDIVQIPLGSHPVVGGPGYKIGYIWCYTTNSTGYMEKFKENKWI